MGQIIFYKEIKTQKYLINFFPRCVGSIFIFWQRRGDSNPFIQSQSLMCYRYTTPLYIVPLLLRHFFSQQLISVIDFHVIFRYYIRADFMVFITFMGF